MSPRNMGHLNTLYEDKCGNCEGDIMFKCKEMCSGCYHNDYNHGLGGQKGCWSYENAKVILRLEVHIRRSPPYNWKDAEPRLSCRNREDFVYVNEGGLDSKGFWKCT
jgi:hypothetical protein